MNHMRRVKIGEYMVFRSIMGSDYYGPKWPPRISSIGLLEPSLGGGDEVPGNALNYYVSLIFIDVIALSLIHI